MPATCSVEFVYYGPEVLRFAERFRQVAEDWEYWTRTASSMRN